MVGDYKTVTGVQLYWWYQMGITDPVDLQWLLEFYFHTSYKIVFVKASLREARRYFD